MGPITPWGAKPITTIHILNIFHFKKNNDKTSYELWHGKPTSINYLNVFGNKNYNKNNEDNLGNFDARVDEGIFLGHSTKSKVYRYNKWLWKIVDNIYVKEDEELTLKNKQPIVIRPPNKTSSEDEIE